ncbi:YabP family protein [compost metagenome]
MARFSRRLRKWTSEALDLPQDILLDMPRVILIGSRQLYIENHKGLMDFTSEHLLLAHAYGKLRIEGRELVITSILPEEICIEGEIIHIRMERTGDEP